MSVGGNVGPETVPSSAPQTCLNIAPRCPTARLPTAPPNFPPKPMKCSLKHSPKSQHSVPMLSRLCWLAGCSRACAISPVCWLAVHVHVLVIASPDLVAMAVCDGLWPWMHAFRDAELAMPTLCCSVLRHLHSLQRTPQN